MNFDFSDDHKQLQQQARRFLADRCPPKAVRVVLDGEAPFDRALWGGLGELGYLGVAIPEAYGGTGAGYLELAVLAEELGRVLAPIPMFSSIYLAAEAIMLAGNAQQKRKWLPLIASGEAIGTLAVFEPGAPLTPQALRVSATAGTISGLKSPVPHGSVADFAVVAARNTLSAAGTGISLNIVELNGASVHRTTLPTLDPTWDQAEIRFDACPAQPLGQPEDGWRILTSLLDRAAVLLAFEQIGGADKALEMARDFALARMAFGRQIGSFQAIKHVLADMYVATSLARSNCYYGAWALASNAPALAKAAAGARISATQAYQHCSRQNIQVHGGMGFTWESDCHLYHRRSAASALALGSMAHWEDQLIDAMVLGRSGQMSIEE